MENNFFFSSLQQPLNIWRQLSCLHSVVSRLNKPSSFTLCTGVIFCRPLMILLLSPRFCQWISHLSWSVVPKIRHSIPAQALPLLSAHCKQLNCLMLSILVNISLYASFFCRSMTEVTYIGSDPLKYWIVLQAEILHCHSAGDYFSAFELFFTELHHTYFWPFLLSLKVILIPVCCRLALVAAKHPRAVYFPTLREVGREEIHKGESEKTHEVRWRQFSN